MDKLLQSSFLKLVRLGIGQQESFFSDKVDWQNIQALAMKQGLSALVLDGVERLPEKLRPPKSILLQWIGVTFHDESQYAVQRRVASEMALLFHNNQIKTYVLKGEVIAECYPNPTHRVSADMDCFLTEDVSYINNQNSMHERNAWALGNDLIKAQGFEVETLFYKNSSFMINGLMVENHHFLTPFRGNNMLKIFERFLQTLLREDRGEDCISETWLYRPPVLVTCLFLIEHAYSHFLHEGLTWKHVLDWMMFNRKHKDDICWADLEVLIDKFRFRRFYDSYNRLGEFLLGEKTEEELSKSDLLMLNDVWADLDLHETVRGWRGKLSLVGNTWRARWTYHYFSDISMLHALWIQVKGFLFIKNPKLD